MAIYRNEYQNYPASATYDPNDPEGMAGLESDAAFSSAPSPEPSLWSRMSDMQRFGVIGNTLQKIGSQLGGEPQPSLHMDRLSVPDLSTSHGPAGQVVPVSLAPIQVNLPGRPGTLALRALGQLKDYI